MYQWIWRRLPGGLGIKAMWLGLIAAVLIALLWFLVFPWAAIQLPITQV
jgi:hypothetical protein